MNSAAAWGARAARVLLLCSASLALATEADVSASSVALGVAPFEVEAPEGAAVPDVAQLLADRLGSRGVARIVWPADLGARPDADVASPQVRAWAAGAEVDAVVVGRTTQVGELLSVDLRLRQGDTGAVSDSFVQEVARLEDLPGAVDSLASRVIEKTAALREPAAAPSAEEAPGAAPAGPAPEAKQGGGAFGFDAWSSDAPLSIESEELNIEEENGRRRLVFDGNVRASQGELTLRSARLVATYPQDGSEPNRLEARGNVRLVERDKKASCDGAVLDRVRDLLTCRGNTAFRDGESCLAGDEIVIDLRKDTVKVKGSATVLIKPDGEACGL
jgi:lipopolysaccharide transport protein LptA